MTNGNSAALSQRQALEFIDVELTQYLEHMPMDETSRNLRDVARAALSVCADGGKASSDVQDAERYRKCRARSITNGVAESAEHFDKMVDESIERVEVKLRTGHNYGKKMQPNGTLK